VCGPQAVHFVTYEWCQSSMNPSRKYDPRVHALAGGCAGALAAAATTPLDVCKTVLNTQVRVAHLAALDTFHLLCIAYDSNKWNRVRT
jgi:hypothetical protein